MFGRSTRREQSRKHLLSHDESLSFKKSSVERSNVNESRIGCECNLGYAVADAGTNVRTIRCIHMALIQYRK